MRTIDGDALMRKLEPIIEAENQIYRRESWGFAVKCRNEVEEAPTIEPEQRWIPCSEGTPKKTGYYICTCHDGVCYRTSTLKWSTGWVLTGARSYWKVIAWMPLPEPYQEERTEE